MPAIDVERRGTTQWITTNRERRRRSAPGCTGSDVLLELADDVSSGLGMLIQAIGSEDMIEGARSFLDRRHPDFRGLRHDAAGRHDHEESNQ